MDALLGRTCSPTAVTVASDPEAQVQHNCALHDRAWSTIAFPTSRGSAIRVSRHDFPPLPSQIQHDPPPGYTYPPPSITVSGSDPSPSPVVDHNNRHTTVVAVMSTVVLFAVAVYYSFFKHSV